MIVHNNNCSGCRACENICPKKSIVLLEKKNRFIQLRDDNCINCGLCDKVCPHLGNQEILKKPILGKNAWAKQGSIYRNASSGGVASIIYQYCSNNDIDCIGVNFTDDFELHYMWINNQKKREMAIGSKYVYSNMNNIYVQIAKKLREHRPVVFIGLPCHVSALCKYLEIVNVSMERCIFVDIVCHGVIMNAVFKKHIYSLIKKRKINIDNIKDIQFRNKNNQFGLTFIHNNESPIYFSKYDDSYMQLYLRGCYIKSCLNCIYAQGNRSGDLSIKDCSTSYSDMKIKSKKQSSILINSTKGLELWEHIKTYLNEYDYPVENMVFEDSMLRHSSQKPKRYDAYYKVALFLGEELAYKAIWGVSSFYKKYFKREK